MKRNIVINATILFIIAAILEMTLHECAHFFAAISIHAKAILYHNYVYYDMAGRSLSEEIYCAAAGPVFSLLIGIVAQLCLRRNIANPLTRLFILFLAVFGYAGFWGYVGIAPFFSYGDTGFVLRALNCPMWLISVLAILAIPCLYITMKSLAKYFISLMSVDIAASIEERKKFINNIVVMPLIFGTIVYTLLNLPVPTTLSLIAPICSPLTILWPFNNYLNEKPANISHDNEQVIAKKISIPWLLILVLTVVVNRLLVSGVSL